MDPDLNEFEVSPRNIHHRTIMSTATLAIRYSRLLIHRTPLEPRRQSQMDSRTLAG